MRRTATFLFLCLSITAAGASAATLRAGTLSDRKAAPRSSAVLFGDQRVGPTADHNAAGTARAFRFANASAGTVFSVSVYVAHGNRARKLVVGLYSDHKGRPGSRLTSGSISSVRDGTWNTVRVGATAVRSGRRYWLAVLGRGGMLRFRDRAGRSCASESYARGGLATLPASWKGGRKLRLCPISAAMMGTRARRPGSGGGNTGGATGGQQGGTSGGSSGGSPGGGGTGGSGGGQSLNCFASPSGCGYPDPGYSWNGSSAWASGGGGVGPNNGTTAIPCSSLPSSGSVTTSSDGQTIQNLNINGQIQIQNANVTINNVCVTTNGGAQLGSNAIKVTGGSATIENSILRGTNDSSQSIEMAVTNFGGGTVTVKHVYAYNCGECLNTGSWNVQDSYILDNGMYNTGDHLETIYVDGSGGETVTVNHSVLLSPPGWDGSGSPNGGQAGLLFGDTNGGSGGSCSTHWNITNNLLAGDGVLIYQCGNASSVGSSTLNFTGNNIARCQGPTHTDSQGYTECNSVPAQTGADTNRTGDGHGYYPNGALKGTDLYTYCNTANWTSNRWDDTGTNMSC